MGGIRARPITGADFPLIAQLFGESGACGGCWCMYWRVPSLGVYWAKHKGEANKRAFKALIESGAARGCLAFDGRRPVGWCSYGAREDFAYLARSRSLPRSALAGVWSISCFYVLAAFRNQSVSGLMIACAVRAAKAAGAAYLEGYPTVPRTDLPIPPAFAHTGLPAAFIRNGFEPVASAGARTVMRIAF